MFGKGKDMTEIKNKVIYLFFTHFFLRRIGKRYPDFFKQWICDYIDKPVLQKILILRYTGETKMKFSAIALELGLDESNMFRYHKTAVETLISAC